MIFCSMLLTTAELKFSRTCSWSMASISDSLRRFSFQFIKHGSAALSISCVVYKNGGYNLCSIIQREEEAHRVFLAGKGFNTNLVYFLPPSHVIISNVHICSFTGTTSLVHKHASKMVLHARNLMYVQKIIIYEGLFPSHKNKLRFNQDKPRKLISKLVRFN